MAHGLNTVLKRNPSVGCHKTSEGGKTGGGIGSRRIFAPHFKLQVLDSYRNDADCKGNQRATARKYGIHRRQIQKWLQVESNLRSSVTKGEVETELKPPTPLDCSTHCRSSPADPAAPIDLSLKRPTSVAAGATPSAPAACPPPSPPRVPSPHSLAQPHPDVWDLSTKRKCAESPTKPVKLFKPYLDEPKQEQAPPCCAAYYYNNNNNNNEIKSEYGTYTLHELQPPSYYYGFPSAYPQTDAPYDFTAFAYEDPAYLQPLKQRHSYSLDFKLSAIECYYQDSVCKGNQRAVASKYNIHRRQVQKWLKQADELRQKNENIKQTQIVR